MTEPTEKSSDVTKKEPVAAFEKPVLDDKANKKAMDIVDENEDIEKPPKDFVHSEGGWGWVVVFAVSYNIGILVGMMNNFALIINKLDTVYNGTENHIFYASWVGASSNGIQFLLVSVASVFVGFFSSRKISVLGSLITVASCLASSFVTDIKLYFLTHSLILAVGQSMLLAGSMAILPHYFSKKLSFVNGIANAGASVLVVVLPVISREFLNNYGLKETFWFLAGLNVLAAVLSMTYISKLPLANNESIVKRLKKSFGVKVFKHLNYNIWLLGTFIGFFGYFIPIVNIDHHSIKTFPEFEPVIVNVVFSTAAGVAALIFGKLGDYTKFNPVHYHTGVWFVYGVVQISIPFATNFYIFCVQLVILGALDGIWLSFKVPIAAHLAGSSALANQASGYFHTAMAPLTVAGPAVAGYLYENYHNYDLAFYLGGTASLICCSILVFGILVPDLFAYTAKKKNNRIANEHFEKNVHLEEINYY